MGQKIPIEVDIGHHFGFCATSFIVGVDFFASHKEVFVFLEFSCAIMEKTSHLSGLPCDVTEAIQANETNDDAFLGDTLSLSQFNVGREIGKGQFSQVYITTFPRCPCSFMFAILFVVGNKVYSATFLPCPSRRVAIKRVELLEMVDSKARADCVKEIQLLKVCWR